MPRVLVLFGSLAAAVVVCAAPAAADPPTPNDSNCAGVVVSSLAGPGFGAAVSTLAHAQLVDNLGLAACGRPPRENP